jgi:hypothetical protein
MTNYSNRVVDNYPLYQAFIDLYYAYTLQRGKASGEINNHAAALDVDRALDIEIDQFYTAYAKDLPQTIAYNKRNLIKILNQIYEAKGTENALKLLFRLIYNDDIQISYPNENVLIPSSGKWIKEKYFTVHIQLGVVPSENSRLTFSNDKGDFAIIVTGTEVLDSSTCRIKFSSLELVNMPMGQIVTYAYGGATFFVGKVIPSPEKLRILRAGQYWKKGKVIRIPGKVRDTVAAITTVGTGGSITNIEILEYGIGHDLNQLSIISPFPRKPTGTIQDIGFEITSINPAAVGTGFTHHPGLTYHYTLGLEDYVDNIEDTVKGTVTGYTHNAYFLSDYMIADYLGTVEFETSTKSVSSLDNVGRDTDIAKWHASLATLLYEHNSLVDMKGKYSGDEGQLSNQLIKIQDSYFYQAFSYLLESIRDPRDYKKMADLFHPAGTKRFSGYIKQINESLPYVFRRAFLVDTIVLREAMSFADSRPALLFGKNLEDSISAPPDSIRYKVDVKTLLDPVITDPSVKMKDFTKILSDLVTYIDINPKTVFKSFVLDSIAQPDVRFNALIKYFTLDSVTPSMVEAKTVIKPRVDTVTYTDNEVPKWDQKVLNDYQSQLDLRPALGDSKVLLEFQPLLEIYRNAMIKAGPNFSDVATATNIYGNNLLKPFIADTESPIDTRPTVTGTKGVADTESPIDTRPKLTPLKALLDSQITADQYAKTMSLTRFADTATITSIDSNGSLVDGRWDIDYVANIDQYSEPFKYLTFS